MTARSAILASLCLISGWWYGIAFSSTVQIGLKQGIVTDLYPFWNGCHAVLHRVDPYSAQVTLQNEIGAFGTPARNLLNTTKERQFAYPAYAAFATFPLGLVPFPIANRIACWAFGALVVLSVGWTRGKWDRRTALYAALALGTYPVIFSLQSRQPTLLFFGLAMAAYALFRCDHLWWAGIVAALACGKPHIALAILLPMFLRSIGEWVTRRAFLFSFTAALTTLSVATAVATPHWFVEWLGSLRAYSKHAAGPSVVTSLFGHEAFIGSAALCVLLVVLLWRARHGDLLSMIALSIVVFQLLLPWEFYNSVALLVPIIWIFDNLAEVNQITLALVRVSLVEYWVSIAVGAALLQLNRLTDVAWQLPVVMLTPILVTTTLTLLLKWLYPNLIRRQTHLREAAIHDADAGRKGFKTQRNALADDNPYIM